MPWARGDMACHPLLDIRDTIALQSRDHECGRKTRALIRPIHNPQQKRLVHRIDLVDDQDLGSADLDQLIEDGRGFLVDAALGIENKCDNVGLVYARPGTRHHGTVEPTLGRKYSRRVDWNELRAPDDGDAAEQRTGGLRFMRYDRDFGTDQRIDQR